MFSSLWSVHGSGLTLIIYAKLTCSCGAVYRYYAKRGGGDAEDALAARAIQAAQAEHDSNAASGGLNSFSKSVDVQHPCIPDEQLDASHCASDAGWSPGAVAVAVASVGGSGPVATADPWNGRPVKMVSPTCSLLCVFFGGGGGGGEEGDMVLRTNNVFMRAKVCWLWL
jgi:hypothetical protein